MLLLRAELLIRIAFAVLVPLSILIGAVLFLFGARWSLGVLVVVTILICLQWPRDRNDDAGTGSGLPVQQPAATDHGLAASAIAGLPAYAYEKRTGSGGGGDDCAVCLGEVQRGEVVKQLPACAHLFHEGCIEAWLRSHGTCPVCRSPVDAALPAAAEVGV